MNKWLSFLLEKLDQDQQTVINLIEIDNEIQNDNYSIDRIKNFIEANINNQKFYELDSNNKTDIITFGTPTTTLKICNDLMGNQINLITNNNYLAINKWINKIYEEYTKGQFIDNQIITNFTSSFAVTNEAVVIGPMSFIEEMSDLLLCHCTYYLDE